MSSGVQKEPAEPARLVRPRWAGAIFVCGKCLKRHRDGKEVRRALKGEMKLCAAKDPTGRKARMVKMACIGLCPKRAIVVASAATLATGDVLLVQDADAMADAFPRLLPRRIVPASVSR